MVSVCEGQLCMANSDGQSTKPNVSHARGGVVTCTAWLEYIMNTIIIPYNYLVSNARLIDCK